MHLCTRSHLSLKLSGSYHWLLLQHPLEHLIHTLNLMCTKQNSIIPRNYATYPNSGGSSIFPLAQAKVWYSFLSPPTPPFLQHSTSDLSGNVLWQIHLKIHLWYDYFSAPFLISFRFKPPSFHTWITELVHITLIMFPTMIAPRKVCYQHSSQSDHLKCKWHHANPLLKTLQIPLSFTQIEFLSARYYIICLFSVFSNLFFLLF